MRPVTSPAGASTYLTHPSEPRSGERIGIGAAVTHRPLPHHRAYGSVHGGSSSLCLHPRQGRQTARAEIVIGKPFLHGFTARHSPSTSAAGSSSTRQFGRNAQLEQGVASTAWSLPLLPYGATKPTTYPAGELLQHAGRFAESEVAIPAPHERSQLGHDRFQTCASGLLSDLHNPFLEPLESFRRNPSPNIRPVREAESEKLPLLRSRYRALRLVDLELELSSDVASHALHHPLTRAFAADVDVAVIRIPHEA